MKSALKNTGLAIMLLFVSGSAWAQSDAKATAILNKVSKLYKSYSTIKSTFTVTTTTPAGKSTSSSGTVWLKGTKTMQGRKFSAMPNSFGPTIKPMRK
jgi:outer membrane lipoprotein-sorting protein